MKNFRKVAFSTICMLIVAVMSLTGATYAWFTTGTTADVSGMEMSVSSVTGGILVSTDETNWTQNLVLEGVKGTNVSPVSTIGGASAFDFFTAELDVANQEITTTTSATSNYISQVLYLKNDTADDMIVNLVGTTITAKANTQGNTLDGYKAARIGIMGATVTGKDSTGYAIYSPNETADSTYLGVKSAGAAIGVADANNENLASVTLSAAADVDIAVAANSTVSITVFIWLEGQDSDCDNAVAKSAFDVGLILNRQG